MNSSSSELTERIEKIEWHWLRPHLERDALIIVDPALDLAETAARVSADDSVQVGAWIMAGQLTKPTPEQIAAWDEIPARSFCMIIVQPYVLIQELPPTAAKED